MRPESEQPNTEKTDHEWSSPLGERFSHLYISELDIELRHEPSGRSVYLFEHPDTPGIHADGVYTFADGAPAYPLDIEHQDLPPGAYAPAEPLAAAFQDVSIGGTWTLTVSDRCGDDVGYLRSARLHLVPACP